ncbi:transcriptional regulator, LuxR family [Catenulispora acidiphila DSM 44928]|uniref:Transcriptional regulator, LuxR family n=1 Tax=Catenulispora acidiphila (strain DSM 44928 / JCM 14897 / NBRC 102108 / NRRL B-24433 / ID139908) TaxID=479433 RepID=C7QJI9_CATAD|nr:LuxR C-terminal-related transcriptional regulator [Catenulispora acidiphila]ACU71212.1 transcriptional regulator, LuxR family [Catenulispora acidiphila DSM 44928]
MPSPAQRTPHPRSAPGARVPTPGEVGLRRILAVADALLGVAEESELVDRLLPVLRRTVPADTVLWLAAHERHPATWRAEPPGAVNAEQAALLAAHADDPLMAAAWHGPGTATRRSDLQTDHEFHRLPVFPALFAPLGARRQLVMAVRPDEERRIVVLFNRASPDFTQHDVAVAEAVRHRIGRALAPFGGPGARREKVSPREADVLDLLCRGLTDRQIATRLGISPRTVDKHLEHAYVKLGVRCRVQAATRWRS